MTDNPWKLNVVGGVCGFIYGGVLFGLSMLFVGPGHGTVMPVAAFGAPISLITILSVAPAFFLLPFMWSALGFLVPHQVDGSTVDRRGIVITILAIHYISAPIAVYLLINA